MLCCFHDTARLYRFPRVQPADPVTGGNKIGVKDLLVVVPC